MSYNSNCPTCRQPAVGSCKCSIGELLCSNQHHWVRCPKHGSVIVPDGVNLHGLATPKAGACTCPARLQSKPSGKELQARAHRLAPTLLDLPYSVAETKILLAGLQPFIAAQDGVPNVRIQLFYPAWLSLKVDQGVVTDAWAEGEEPQWISLGSARKPPLSDCVVRPRHALISMPTAAQLGGRFQPSTGSDFAGWTDDARTAMQANPDYFVWWYTAKSLALVAVAVTAAYYIGRNSVLSPGPK